MAKELTAGQVLEVAERMERNAVRFYRKAAGTCDDSKISRLFVDLARWERQHVRVFTEMRERLSESGDLAGAGQNRRFGRFVLDVTDESPTEPPLPLVFGDRERPSDELAGCRTKAEVLKMAIQKEKDTISYFTSLQGLVPGCHNAHVIGEVIHEEERHMKILTQSLEQTAER
jgi:rubrerythrin